MVRSCENQGNLSGTIAGWTDMKLTDYGRRQAFMLNQIYAQNEAMFHQIHSSDLQRCVDTAFYALGFPSNDNLIQKTKNLREMNFGEQEGLHFDGLSASEKEVISSPDYHAPGGESWAIVRARQEEYFSGLAKGNHLIFTHGGPIAAQLLEFGVE